MKKNYVQPLWEHKPQLFFFMFLLFLLQVLSILNTTQFAELDHDPTAYVEGKVQRTLRKIKNKLPSFVYSKIYPKEIRK